MCRHRSKSTGFQSELSLSQQPRSDVNDDGELYLPGIGGICITKTKHRKPASGRKKESQLKDLGFDPLGYLFGFASYKDLKSSTKRQVRPRMSFSSQPQSSAPTTISTTIRIFKRRGRPSQRSHSRGRAVSPVTVGESSRRSSSSAPTTTSKSSLKKSLRSSSISTPVRSCHCGSSQSSNSSLDGTSEAREETSLPGNTYPSTSMPPPSRPLPSTQNFGNSLPTTPNVPVTPNAGSQGFAVQTPNTGSILWIQPVTPTPPGHHYVQASVLPVSQPSSIPLYVQQSQSTVQQPVVISPTYPISGPVSGPASLPASQLTYQKFPPGQLRSGGSTGALNKPVRFSPNEARKCEEHYNAALKAGAQGTNGSTSKVKNKKENEAEDQRSIGKHIQHINHCAGCGRVRSKAYQRAHPLERGQIPEPAYCAKCLRDAASMESDEIDNASVAQSASEGAVSTTDTDVPHSPPSKKKELKSRSTSGKLGSKRPRRPSLLPSVLSDSTVSEHHPSPPTPVSSTGQSDSRGSASIMNSRAENRKGQPMSSVKDGSHETNGKEPASRPDASRRSRRISRSEEKGPVLKNDIRVASFSSAANLNEDKLTGTAQVREPNDSRGDVYNATSPKVPTGGRSRTPQPRFPEPSLEVKPTPKPKASVQSVSDYSEETGCPDYKIRGEAPKVVGDDHSHANSSRAARETPKTFSSEAHDTNPWSKKQNRRVHGWADTYWPTREDRRIYEQQQTPAHTEAGPEQPIRDPEPDRRRHSNRRRVRRHQDRTATPHHGARDSEMDRATDTEPDTPDDPNYTFKWDLPPTPTDISHASRASNPYFMGHYWRSSENMSDVERDAEELAEQYQAAAGKHFSGMANPFGSSSPSQFSIRTFVTRTQLSVKACDPNEGPNPNIPNTTMFELAESSDGSEAVDPKRSVKGLEFSGEDDLNRKAAARTRGRTASTNRATQGRRGDRSESSKKASEKKAHQSGVKGSSSSSNQVSPNADSSLVVHTGHSMENLRSGDQANSSVQGRRRRIRRPSRL
ncbi:hypothetical protein F5Y06DRAFT_307989 [Hypoxylon sp. FL0890]|nr:hypothetical protein F5Y06DRAFT_307989 [Hypoxylon sp. FL0890]